MDQPERRYTLLVVDDDPAQAALVRELLHGLPLEILSAGDKAEALELFPKVKPQLVLLDLVLPGVTGMELLECFIDTDPSCAVMLLTAHYSTDSAVEAIQKGAYDYLTKPLPVDRLRQKVERWIEETRRWEEAELIESGLASAFQFEGIVGRSPVMREVFSKIRRIAPHFSTVLVSGETGTGKELVASALHRLSPAGRGPFVVCNCAAITETLFESELFGHVRGAFTGAVKDKPGLVEQASGGTLFLDEIGEVPAMVQAKLLRLIQNREVQRVGAERVFKVDVRIIAATNRNLRDMVAKQTFREDLYYRLAMVEIRVPPLRQRKDDLSLLLSCFLKRFSTRYGKPWLKLSPRAEIALTR
jgi:DNA-binding NtrC family response regulator